MRAGRDRVVLADEDACIGLSDKDESQDTMASQKATGEQKADVFALKERAVAQS